MLLTLTDHLTCPRCGPATGLILLLEEADDRRVRTGALGCPACRTRYRIAGRVADLRAEEGAESAAVGGQARAPARAPGQPAELAIRVAALLGLGEGAGFVLVAGPLGLDVAMGLAGLLPDQELVVPIEPGRSAEVSELDLSALLRAGALPLAGRTMAAVAHVGGAPDADRLLDLLRVCRPTGRLLVELGPGESGGAAALDAVGSVLEGAGAQVRARDASGLLAVAM